MAQAGIQLKYNYTFDLEGDHAGAHVLRLVPPGAKVLEIGAGAGSISRPLVEVSKCRLTALEIDPPSVEHLKTFCERVFSSDLNDPNWHKDLEGCGRFDAVVIADVLEHLLDPLTTLKSAASLLTNDGAVVVSLPHIANNAIIACLLTSDFDYREWGLLDKTHLRFFAIENIKRLVAQAGLKIVDVRFVVKPPETTEFAERWQRLSESLRQELSVNRFGWVYQVVFRAVRKDAPGTAIDLASVEVPGPSLAQPPAPRRKRRGLMRSKRVRRFASRLGFDMS